MHDGMPYGRNQGQGQGHSREVDRQSPTGLIFIIIIINNDYTRLTASLQDNLGKLVPECHHSICGAKDEGDGSDRWSFKTCKAPVRSSSPRNQHPAFLQLCHWSRNQECQSTEGRKCRIPWTCSLKAHLGVFQPCLWPLKTPDYLGERITKPLISPLMPVSFTLSCLKARIWLDKKWDFF